MSGVFDELQKRGFLYQCTGEAELRQALGAGTVTFYVGFDPTADSLHVGSLIPILAMVHMQRAGHRAIALTGGGTAMVGDPSGKTEMRQMLTEEKIRANAAGISSQLARFLVLDGQRGLALDNITWLRDLKYIDFLREIGRHFSVNRMLSAESYRMRLETGLSFLEFNYMLLQAYDFLVLFREQGCTVQLGGQDQWGNIVAGIDLVRRETGGESHGLTFPLLTDASGNKLGKTVAGAIWLSSDRTSPFDFYQFWRNTDDRDVERFLKLFTFLPVDECERLGKLQPPLLNRAKEILAFEITRIVHGDDVARQTYLAIASQFGTADPDGKIQTSSPVAGLSASAPDALPELAIPAADLADGIMVADLLVRAGFCASRGEARRMIRQGGTKLGENGVADETLKVTSTDLASSPILKAGKKRMVKIVVGG